MGVALHTHRDTAAVKTANITGPFFFPAPGEVSGWVVMSRGGERVNEEESEQWGRAKGVEMRGGKEKGRVECWNELSQALWCTFPKAPAWPL